MVRRVAFSGEHHSIEQIANHHRDIDDGLRLFYSVSSPNYNARFLSYKPSDVADELKSRLEETDRQSTMMLLAAVEAAFRINYLQRCYDRRKDDVSRRFRELHDRKAAYASLDEDILEVWRSIRSDQVTLIGHIRGAFNYRHWIAHGRYWVPKLGGQYDFATVYGLAEQAFYRFSL